MHSPDHLQHSIAQIHTLLEQGHHDSLPERVHQYSVQVHAACTNAGLCPPPEVLHQLLARHQQVMVQMRAQQQVLAQTLSTHRQSGRAARAYLSGRV